MNTLPGEVLTQITRDLDLHALFAFKQTNQSNRQLVSRLPDSHYKDLVLERVPWMELGQPETGLDTWFDAAKRVFKRHNSFKNEPDIWISSDQYISHRPEMMKQTDVVHGQPANPYLNNTYPTWYGLLSSEKHGSGELVTLRSGLKLVSEGEICARQETSEWVLVECEDGPTIVVDKRQADSTLSCSAPIRTYGEVSLHFLPDRQGAIVFEQLEEDVVLAFYDDFSPSNKKIPLVKLSVDLWDLGNSPNKVLTYGGLLYIRDGGGLVPLWVEIDTNGVAVGGARQDMKTLFVTYEGIDEEQGLVISRDKRWVAYDNLNGIVADVATGKSYITPRGQELMGYW